MLSLIINLYSSTMEKLNFKNKIMSDSKKYSGEFISLYDHLGHAAAKAGVKPIIKELKTSYYEGEIYTYPSEFLDEYFKDKK